MDISTSFAVPFDETTRAPFTSFLDFDYLREMAEMFKAVNASEKVVGWYSTGTRIKPIDSDIQAQMKTVCDDPIYVIVDPEMKTEDEIPLLCYHSVVQLRDGGTQLEFDIVDATFKASEVEDVAVEHLLRDVQQHKNVTTLEREVEHKLTGIRGLKKRLRTIGHYCDLVAKGSLPSNQEILHNIQTIFNLKATSAQPKFMEAMKVQSNDNALTLYIASLTRTLLMLDKLIDNRAMNKEEEQKKREEEQKELKRKKNAKEKALAAADKAEKSPKKSADGKGEKMDEG